MSTKSHFRQRDMVLRELLIATSTFLTCGLLLQTGAQYSAAGNTRACVEIRSVLSKAPHVVPARRRMSETLYVTLPATSSRCCCPASGPGSCWNIRRLFSPNMSFNYRLASLLLQWLAAVKSINTTPAFSLCRKLSSMYCVSSVTWSTVDLPRRKSACSRGSFGSTTGSMRLCRSYHAVQNLEWDAEQRVRSLGL